MKPLHLAALVLAMLAGTVLQSAQAGPVDRSAEHSERWLVACLNGVTIQVGDTLYQCLPSGHVK